MIRARTLSGVKAASALRVRDGGAVLKTVGNVRVRDASSTLRLVYSSASGGAFTVSASPLVCYGGRAGGATLSVTSEEVSVSITGGSGPYTYAWSLIAAVDGTWAVTAPNADKTNFVVSSVPSGDTYTATFKCTVTDARGLTADSATVQVNCTNYGDLGGILP